jgi:Fur family transcriptional regulator, ferric uptake regulator
MNDYAGIYAMLRAKGFRVTSQKKRILDVFLENSDRMLSVHDVCSLLPEDTSVDNATVYRNVQKFLNFGILESINDEQGINRYTVSERNHHHYLICTECGKIIKIPCESHFWKAKARENNFLETHHKLEVYGKCAECANIK